jgi:hypothetical protein
VSSRFVAAMVLLEVWSQKFTEPSGEGVELPDASWGEGVVNCNLALEENCQRPNAAFPLALVISRLFGTGGVS